MFYFGSMKICQEYTKIIYQDIVVLDFENIKDNTTINEPFNKPQGIDYVIINGEVILENGELTGKANGRFIKN